MQRSYLRDTLICLIPLLFAGFLTVRAYNRYQEGEPGGFKLGVDLSGGTIMVYEVDRQRTEQTSDKTPDANSQGAEALPIDKLAEALKKRIDPTNIKDVTIRPVGTDRVEIILPTGGGASSSGQRRLTEEEVQKVKDLIRAVGSLEFRILANDLDDTSALRAAREYFEATATNSAQRDLLNRRAEQGLPPPFPPGDYLAMGERANYSWVELGPQERTSLGLQNAMGKDPQPGTLWSSVAAKRATGEVYNHTTSDSTDGSRTSMLIWSRPTVNKQLSEAEREEKQIDYFLLTRSSDSVKVGGNVTISAYPTQGEQLRPAIGFRFNSIGASQFYALTSKNVPSSDSTQGGKQARQLSIILDGLMISAPRINQAISNEGQITGNYTVDEVNYYVALLRQGALPATLKRDPVSINTIAPTLGIDTIVRGTWSVIWAFVAVLAFMIFYYRFAGVVACIALMANLLLTVGFMILVNATFTLPGLAGLVLTLGMAVDANVLIYERLREERDRGASLLTAIRNGYDHAFPTIIDTHLSSIFTACVLYAVGNDQLKGFGVSLTLGLVISLFTSLFITRLIFDYALSRKLLTNLKMLRIFSKPNYDFMKIRNVMFTATLILTIAGLGLFLWRGDEGLNVDFRGGTVYGGVLREGEARNISELRQIIDPVQQAELLAVEEVTLISDVTDSGQNSFEILYTDGTRARLSLNPDPSMTAEQQRESLVTRAEHLPNVSVEQIFLQGTERADGRSRFFTIRTTEREPELVQISIDRLFRAKNEGGEWTSLLAKTDMQVRRQGNEWLLDFDAPTSPSFIKMLFEREFLAHRISNNKTLREGFELRGVGEDVAGRYKTMEVTPTYTQFNPTIVGQNVGIAFGAPLQTAGLVNAVYMMDYVHDQTLFRNATNMLEITNNVKKVFDSRPQPERLETFDSTLASETRSRAFVAILLSWAAILMYLWFRFGNWTFGLAAVLCLIHDLCFVLGIIALSHYLFDTMFGRFLLLQDFRIDLPTVAALLTLVGYSVNDTIVVFDRIREVRGKNPALTPTMINQSVNQTLSRTLLASATTWLVVLVLYFFGGEGIHLFAFVMVVGVVVGTYSSIYVASPLLIWLGEGHAAKPMTTTSTSMVPAGATKAAPEPKNKK